MRAVSEVNKYVSDSEPWKLKGDDERARLGTVLHVVAQCVADLNTILSPFLPFSANAVDAVLGGAGDVQPMPRAAGGRRPGRGSGLPDPHRRLHRGAARWERRADRARHARREADAGVHQARPVGRRRGARPARLTSGRRRPRTRQDVRMTARCTCPSSSSSRS